MSIVQVDAYTVQVHSWDTYILLEYTVRVYTYWLGTSVSSLKFKKKT